MVVRKKGLYVRCRKKLVDGIGAKKVINNNIYKWANGQMDSADEKN
jgi:hypothetical protein